MELTMRTCALKIVGNILPVLAKLPLKIKTKITSSLKTGLARIVSDLKVNLKQININATGLDTQLTSWWIRHPQAIPCTGISNYLNSIIRLNWLVINCIYTICINTFLGARIESQRKRSHFAFLCWRCFAATQSTFVNSISTGKSL
jgi:hypothetical protein